MKNSIKMSKFKRISILILAIMMLSTVFATTASAGQIYTNPVSSGGCTGTGNLYATRVNDYIRIGAAGTYVTGSGTVTSRAWLYVHGWSNPWEGFVSGNAASGVSANSGQQIFTASDNAQWVRSEHHFRIGNGSWINVHTGSGLHLSIWDL